MASSIFIVDSSPAVRRMVEQISTPEGFDVVGFQDGPAALEAARRISPALIIADYHLDNMTFSGFCKEVNKLDSLSETFLISLVNPADRPDENLLKTLGVKAVLNKPFQSEDLLDVIKNLPHKTQPQQNGARLKRRVWPPDSTSTDTDHDDAVMNPLDISDEQESHSMDHSQDAAPIATNAAPPPPGPEEAMKGLFGQLLESMTERTERRIADLLPHAIEKELATRIRSAVKAELDGQLGEILSQEQLMTIVHPLLVQELPSLIRQEMAANEALIRQAVSDVASPAIKDMLDQSVRELAEASVRKQLPDVVREHLGSIDLLVKEEIRQATLKHAPLIADDLVRATAEQTVEQAVQRIVPELAEQHIKAELTRLTAVE
ncbi:MAG: response regulator [Nitrospira sp.]|nr:response regulator [Nitrospira sp.]